jgi:hypothetical protein
MHEKIGKRVDGVVVETKRRGFCKLDGTTLVLRVSDPDATGDKFGAFAALLVGAMNAASRFDAEGELWLIGIDDDAHVEIVIGPDLPAAPGGTTLDDAKASLAFAAVRDTIGFTEDDCLALDLDDDV